MCILRLPPLHTCVLPHVASCGGLPRCVDASVKEVGAPSRRVTFTHDGLVSLLRVFFLGRSFFLLHLSVFYTCARYQPASRLSRPRRNSMGANTPSVPMLTQAFTYRIGAPACMYVYVDMRACKCLALCSTSICNSVLVHTPYHAHNRFGKLLFVCFCSPCFIF